MACFSEPGRSAIVVEGDKRLFNQYGVMLVNSAKCPSVKKELGQQFIDWLISPEGQKVIAGYKINGNSFSIRMPMIRTFEAAGAGSRGRDRSAGPDDKLARRANVIGRAYPRWASISPRSSPPSNKFHGINCRP